MESTSIILKNSDVPYRFKNPETLFERTFNKYVTHAIKAFIKEHQQFDVPLHLRNAPTKLMENLDYGKNYRYAHNEPDAYAAGVKYFPDEIDPIKFYKPTNRGLEIRIKEKLDYLKSLDDSYKTKQDKK